MLVGENIKILRKRMGKSQEDVASALGLNRSTYSGYENNIAQPNLENMVSISKFFGVTVEDMLSNAFSDYTETDWLALRQRETGHHQGQSLRVLASKVTEDNEELVEVIPEKATAGYTTGYADPSFFEDMPTLRLPFLSKHKKYRAFSIHGDSMPPVSQGSIVVAEYVQDWTSLSNGKCYVLVTRSEGIVFKKVHLSEDRPGLITLVSTNIQYAPYEIPYAELLEVWRFVSYISRDLPDVKPDDSNLLECMHNLQLDVKRLLQRK